ncbi:MAG: hypothetical protein KAG72_15210 [Abyssibacter sp.]|nr:hypothetical protein [Abyssibacter sp.]MCK5860698.1 hypothetical protein [Abyssibacter sp.]
MKHHPLLLAMAVVVPMVGSVHAFKVELGGSPNNEVVIGGSGNPGDVAGCVGALSRLSPRAAAAQGLPSHPGALEGLCKTNARFQQLNRRQWQCVASRISNGEPHAMAIGRCY